MAHTSRKTVFLAINYAVNVRDILRGDVFRILRESGHHVVIVTPAADEPKFIQEFKSKNVTIERLVVHQPGKLERWFDTLRFTLFPELSSTVRIVTTPTRERSLAKKALASTAMAIKRLLGANTTRRAFMWLNVRVFPDRHHARLFDRYRPDLVCLTEMFHLAPDSWLLKRAVREKVPTVGLVRSWDNLTTKGIFPAPVGALVVWSETMRDEAVRLHGYGPDRVYVGGVPHFDVLTDVQNTSSRDQFLRRIGADPARKLITYAMAPLTRSDGELEQLVVEHLWRLAGEDRFCHPAQVLVRMYPLRASEIPPRLASLPGLLIDLPGRSTPVFTDRDISLEDLRHLAATMRHSDVVVNLASTIAIDAAVCGTPAVCVGFDAKPTPYLRSVTRYFDFEHHRRLRATGGVRVASTLDELVELIDRYLRDPALDAEGRERIVQQQCYRPDGHAGERIGRFVLDYLDRLSGAAADRAPAAAEAAR